MFGNCVHLLIRLVSMLISDVRGCVLRRFKVADILLTFIYVFATLFRVSVHFSFRVLIFSYTATV